MITGEELALRAMKREYARLSAKAKRLQDEVDECLGVCAEMIKIHNETVEVIKSKENGHEVLKKLDALKKRSDRADDIRKKDLLKLMERQNKAEMDVYKLAGEIERVEFGMKLRKEKAA